MNEPSLRIGALARHTGRSVHAIRWYEAQGLIPGVRRDAGGRRAFAPEHVGWLQLMDRLRCTGMSIAQMRRYTSLVRQGRATSAERRQMLREHRDRVQATIAEWNDALALLDGKIDFYGQWLHTGRRPPLDVLPAAAPARKPRPR